MSESSKPAQVGSNEGLGLVPERAAFEAWFSDGGKWPEAVRRSGEGYMLAAAQSAWTAWKAAWAARLHPLSDAAIEQGREATFSTSNPFCPCDSKTMRKAVRWAERAHGIKA